jgi:CheY-like chemotaxis protein
VTEPDRAIEEREAARGLGDALALLFGAARGDEDGARTHRDDDSEERGEAAPSISSLAWRAARDVAGLLGLGGLDRLLAALEPHAGGGWPPPLDSAIDRLARLAARLDEDQHLGSFREADAELDAVATEIESVEWMEDGARGPMQAVRLVDALADLPWEPRGNAGAAQETRLAAPTAAALRAALEWTAGENGPRRPFEIALEDDSLSVTFRLNDPAGLPGAHAALGPVGGVMGPWLIDPPSPGSWAVRVPVIRERSRFLMFEQGGERFALPWHSVLRLSMWPAGEPLAEHARSSGAPLLPPLVPRVNGAPRASEHPWIMIASGLQRGSLSVDRVVWRLAAEIHTPSLPGPMNLERAARTGDGEDYWIIDPHRLLASLPLPDLGMSTHRRLRRIPEPQAPRLLTEVEVTPIPIEVAAIEESQAIEASQAIAAAAEIEPGETLTATIEPVAVADEPVPGEPAAESRQDRALIVEDSITARAFLSRMLEARGYEVLAFETAAQALAELPRGDWSLVLADVDLPDARGAEWLRTISERAPGGAAVIALVRDREDRDSATEAGVSRVLRKPFDPAEVTELIERVSAATRGGS